MESEITKPQSRIPNPPPLKHYLIEPGFDLLNQLSGQRGVIKLRRHFLAVIDRPGEEFFQGIANIGFLLLVKHAVTHAADWIRVFTFGIGQRESQFMERIW